MLDLTRLAEAVRYEGGISRRLFLAFGSALAALPRLADTSRAADRKVTFPQDPFSLGVASGDPGARSVVIWTRLAPRPLEPDGGLTEPIPVRWSVSEDTPAKTVVASGTTIATPQLGHSVHVEVFGLQPDRWYQYRFEAGDAVSPVGRTRTLPAPETEAQNLKFAATSCQHWEQGLFTGYEQMVRDDLDLVFHLGDYIYEGAAADNRVRKHVGQEIQSLGDYRVRHALYKSDPLLQGMHAACPWFVTWDDHEFDNNCAGAISEEKDVDPVDFLRRRANAYQAYYEAMPLRRRSLPQGPDMLLYRSASFGRLAELLVLDTRQYRTDQPNGDQPSEINEAALDPRATLLGTRQRGWLQEQLIASEATWNVLAQQVMMGMVSGTGPRAGKSSMDQWPGYAWERMELMKFLEERRVPNPVVLTGDIHSNWANELRVDDRRPETPVIASEFVATSLSSGGNGKAVPDYLEALQAANPCIKVHNTERGYLRCSVTPEKWVTEYVAVTDVMQPGGPIETRVAVTVEAGRPGIQL